MSKVLRRFFTHEAMPDDLSGGGFEPVERRQEAEIISLPTPERTVEGGNGLNLNARQREVAAMFEAIGYPMGIGITESNLRKTGHRDFNLHNVTATIKELVELGILWEPESGIYVMTSCSLEQYEQYVYGEGEPAEENGGENPPAVDSRSAA